MRTAPLSDHDRFESLTAFGVAVRLALVLSAVAALATIALMTLGDVSPAGLVAGVAIVGFTASWVLTGRAGRTHEPVPAHRITVIPIRQPVG